MGGSAASTGTLLAVETRDTHVIVGFGGDLHPTGVRRHGAMRCLARAEAAIPDAVVVLAHQDGV